MFTSAKAKVFASYVKFGAIPEHFSLSSKEQIDELLMTQVLWQKSMRKVMNENQVLRAFFWLKNLRQNDYLIESVLKWTLYLGRKHNKFSQSAALDVKVYVTDFFLFARLNLPNVLINIAKKKFQ